MRKLGVILGVDVKVKYSAIMTIIDAVGRDIDRFGGTVYGIFLKIIRLRNSRCLPLGGRRGT